MNYNSSKPLLRSKTFKGEDRR